MGNIQAESTWHFHIHKNPSGFDSLHHSTTVWRAQKPVTLTSGTNFSD